MSKHVLAAVAVAAASAVTIAVLSFSNGQTASAQTQASPVVVSASSNGLASTVWIVDAGRRNVVLCRQSIPTSSGDEALQFGCKSQPLP